MCRVKERENAEDECKRKKKKEERRIEKKREKNEDEFKRKKNEHKEGSFRKSIDKEVEKYTENNS